jgi:hypothetical protein
MLEGLFNNSAALASGIAGIIVWLMGIVVLIKLVQREGCLMGILGFICMIYTFVWGWMHAKRENLTTVMIIWSILVGLAFIASGGLYLRGW